MPEPITTTAILVVLIPLIGIILKNKALIVLGVLVLLLVFGPLLNLPMYVWIIVIIVMFLWITKWK